ncbi:MAG: NADH-quinone oxidoreductase subunit A [Dehalococcoidales bacterium]|jgi:NADH-quinone oxidoreductase subunit A|nr:NADH-quinone oxidoreductase subunit A [Dehalococcoidales bacterium]MDP6738233.1 NADH-quinone oxidoreductase subunit A [Dehalococcoidales bacterium]|tara:strand:+ start:2369 stop:2740 length:372 start_codon:yes stop_codon:yes gene_type:complete
MATDYIYIALFLLAAIFFVVTTLLIPVTLRFLKIIPHKPTPVKGSPFECGVETIGKTWVQFNLRYYLYALVFLVIDVLVVFLYPWAVNIRHLGLTGLIEMLILLTIVTVGYIYAWKKGALEWK